MREFSYHVLALCLINTVLVLCMIIYFHQSSKDGAIVADLSTTIRRANSISQKTETVQTLQNVLGNKAKIAIIEPSELFVSLPAEDQQLLLEKGFKIGEYWGRDNVLSLAVLEEDLGVLRDHQLNTELESVGFTRQEIKKPSERWLKSAPVEDSSITTHVLYVRLDVVLHFVVFYNRGHYMWHGDHSHNGLFGNESIFDRFQFVPYSWKGSLSDIYAPSNIPKFLFQIPVSRFVGCNGTVKSIAATENSDPNEIPLWFLEQTTISVVEELENLLGPSLSPFWLGSGTLLGWYRDCGIIPYTSDVDFGAWAGDITNKMIEKFKKSENLKLLNTLGKVSEDLEFWLLHKFLRVDLFFTYEDRERNAYYVGGHRPEIGYSFRYMFPKFSLCSTDFLDHRVLVPCDSEAILEAEYGKNWRIPVKSWNYELSAHNVLGRRYWDENEVKYFRNFPESSVESIKMSTHPEKITN